MSILTENSKKMLVEAMRSYVSDLLTESKSLTAKQATEKMKFVKESATYEQLLNITMNPHRDQNYQPSYVLEGAVAILHSACMTGRKHIGPNAIAEGALKLQKKTGVVITESMLEAALTAVNEGCGLKVVGKLLTEASEWTHVLNLIHDPGARNYVETQLAQINKGVLPGFDTTAISILKNASGAAGYANLERFIQNMNDPQWIRRSRLLDNIKSNIAVLNAKKAAGKISDAENETLSKLLQQRVLLSKSLGKNAGNGAMNRLQQTLGNVSQKSSGTPWGKIALGAAALGGIGTLGYQYLKNRKAMHDDMNRVE